MKNRNFLLGFTILIVFTFWSHETYASCVETGPGGELSKGRISKEEVGSLLGVLAAGAAGTSLYLVQNNKGYYAKVCNEPDQIKHFEEKFHPGKWEGPKKVQGDDIYKYTDKNGVIKIEKTKGGWLVY